MLTEISKCCLPTAVIATNTLRLDVSAITELVTHKEVGVYLSELPFKGQVA